MAFAFCDRHIDEYRTQGYTVFRQVLPLSLIADLRRVCDEARDLARQEGDPARRSGYRRVCSVARRDHGHSPGAAGRGTRDGEPQLWLKTAASCIPSCIPLIWADYHA